MISLYLSLLDSQEEQNKFEKLYLEHRSLMFSVARNILQDDELAEDAVHQAFIKIIENFHKINDFSSHKTRGYFVIIVRNTAIDIYRRRRGREALPFDEELYIDPLYQNTELSNHLAEAVLSLPAIYKDAMKLQYICGFSSREAAEQLGISAPAFRKRIYRAKRRLKEIMTKLEESDE